MGKENLPQRADWVASPLLAVTCEIVLDRWKVQPLFSLRYTPEYNGSIEAGNGALKTRPALRMKRPARAATALESR